MNQITTMPKTTREPRFTNWLKTVPNSRRDFLTKVCKEVLLASLGMFGAGCEIDRVASNAKPSCRQ